MEAGVEIQALSAEIVTDRHPFPSCPGNFPSCRNDSIVQLEGIPQRFSYNELSEVTRGFSKDSKLGVGAFGVVYQGELSGIQVAIKRMNPEATQRQGMKEFNSEVKIISQVRHRSLIKLRGYCADGDSKEYILVYDLMPNGSLDDALFKGTTSLSWPQLFKILTDIADGLGYLHEGLSQQVIHRDIKCSNILLDNEWNAKLGDFGIARMVAHQGRAATTDMAGTMGYMAPEVFREYQFTNKADVYAFGVVVLEAACGRRVLPGNSQKEALVQWVWFAHREGNLLSTVDRRHRGDDNKQIQRVLEVGLLCTQVNPQDRPSMKRVVQMLAGDVTVPSVSWGPSQWATRASCPTAKQKIKVASVPTSKPVFVPSSLKRILKMIPGLASRSPQNVSVESHVKNPASGTSAKVASLGLVTGIPRTVMVESSVTLAASDTRAKTGFHQEKEKSKKIFSGLVSRRPRLLSVASSANLSTSANAANLVYPGLMERMASRHP